MNQTSILSLLTLILSVCPLEKTLAQDDANKPVEKRLQRVVFKDTEGNPIPGVKFTPWGLNMSYFWPTKLMGDPKDTISDADGLALIEYPAEFASKLACSSIDGTISHPDYIGTVGRLTVSETSDYEVILKQGIRLKVVGIDAEGNPIKEKYGVCFGGEAPPTEWPQADDGSIQSKSVATGVNQLMLVQPMPDGKTRFSQPLLFNFNEADLEEGKTVDDIELEEGIRVFGTISADVIRPVKNGRVLAIHMPLAIENGVEKQANLLAWSEQAKINEDGTFEMASMPRFGRIQLIAICDGWTGLGKRVFTEGQTFFAQDMDLEVELKMERTTDVVLFVLDEFDNPIEGAEVFFSPNQLWKDYGSQILGEGDRSIDSIEVQLGMRDKSILAVHSWDKYSGKTDATGKILVDNIPIRGEEPFSVSKKGFIPLEDVIESNSATVTENGQRVVEKSIALKPMTKEDSAE
jgi:hypothetical protein